MKHEPKCLDQCSMRRSRNPPIQLNSHMLCVRGQKVHNILKNEEDQREYHSDFGPGKEYLNEESLENEDDVEHY